MLEGRNTSTFDLVFVATAKEPEDVRMGWERGAVINY